MAHGLINSPTNNFGKTVQFLETSTNVPGSSANNIPFDNTIPQNTEGTELLTLTITPISALSRIRVFAHIHLMDSTVNYPIIALFKNDEADAIAVSLNQSGPSQMSLLFSEVTGTVSPITYKMRVGADGGTFYWNQRQLGIRFNGVVNTVLQVEELLP